MATILIFGTGAMACLFAAKLSRAGNKIHMVGSWQAAINQINANGITLLENYDIARANALAASTSRLGELGKYDHILFLNKTYQLDFTLNQLASIGSANIRSDTTFLTLQNGIGNVEKIKKSFPSHFVCGGSTTYAAKIEAPGVVKLTGHGVVELPMVADICPLVDIFKNSNLITRSVQDIDSILWGKLVINSAINPLSAIHKVENGQLVTKPFLRRKLIELAQESAIVANANGVQLPYPDVESQLIHVCRSTATNRSSMLQDVTRGGQTEIGSINGEVIKAARNVGVLTPLNERIFFEVTELVKTNEG